MQEDQELPRLAEPSDNKEWLLGRWKGVFGKETVVRLLKSRSPRSYFCTNFSLE